MAAAGCYQGFIHNMTTLSFYKLSEIFLMSLADKIEKSDMQAVFDVEYSDGILTITVEQTGQEYVINRHNANQKIWYSSPLSGADYFSLHENGKWIGSKGEELEEKLTAELEKFK